MPTFTTVTDSQIRKNLRKWLALATDSDLRDGLMWYNEAHTFCQQVSIETGVDAMTAAGVLSALSPNNKWERNKIDALALCRAWSTGGTAEGVRVCTYNANKAKAWRILEGDREAFTAGSPKTCAFAQTVGNLSEDSVVIDRWHCRACLTSAKSRKTTQESPTAAQYNRIEAITIQEAEKAGVVPYALQAIIWVTIKRIWETK